MGASESQTKTEPKGHNLIGPPHYNTKENKAYYDNLDHQALRGTPGWLSRNYEDDEWKFIYSSLDSKIYNAYMEGKPHKDIAFERDKSLVDLNYMQKYMTRKVPRRLMEERRIRISVTNTPNSQTRYRISILNPQTPESNVLRTSKQKKIRRSLKDVEIGTWFDIGHFQIQLIDKTGLYQDEHGREWTQERDECGEVFIPLHHSASPIQIIREDDQILFKKVSDDYEYR